MEFNYDADKKPVILVPIEDFECMAHAALYAGANIEYIKHFPIMSHRVVEASGRIESALGFINKFKDDLQKHHEEVQNDGESRGIKEEGEI